MVLGSPPTLKRSTLSPVKHDCWEILFHLDTLVVVVARGGDHLRVYGLE